jgi:hypothetical protein
MMASPVRTGNGAAIGFALWCLSPRGTSRHFAAMRDSVAIGGKADIDQVAPKLDLNLPNVNDPS